LHAELHAPPGTPLPAPLVEPVAIHAGGKGELKVLLAHPWDGARNVTGWFMSEKLDGVRAYWDGANFLSRNGNVFEAPDWYRDRMPKGVHLDGELWMGRGRFQETSGYVRRMDKGERWRDITYQVFDAPSVKGTFVERMAAIGRDFMLPAHCTKLQHDVVESHDHLRSFVAGIEALGGEGGMVRDPKSLYVRGRHESLLKVKSFFETEAVIVGHEPGKGRHKGAVGAYNCLIPEDVTLRAGGKVCHLKKLTKVDVGTGQSDADRKLDNPRGGIGNRITFCFQELSTTGVPRFPSFKGFRDYE
jgi:DNA ligase-1